MQNSAQSLSIPDWSVITSLTAQQQQGALQSHHIITTWIEVHVQDDNGVD